MLENQIRDNGWKAFVVVLTVLFGVAILWVCGQHEEIQHLKEQVAFEQYMRCLESYSYIQESGRIAIRCEVKLQQWTEQPK